MDTQKDLFGQVAVRRGFVDEQQVRRAINTQRDRSNGIPRLLGLVMLEEGMISTGQLIEVLREVRLITTERWMKRRDQPPRIKEQAS